MSILAILEQRDGVWKPFSWQILAAAQQLGRELGRPVCAAVAGDSVSHLAQEAAGYRLARVYAVEHPLLKRYTPDAYVAALEVLLRRLNPCLVLFPHSYRVRDFAPKLATRFRRVLVTDAIGHRVEAGELVLIRQLFQGKLDADVRFLSEHPQFRLASGRGVSRRRSGGRLGGSRNLPAETGPRYDSHARAGSFPRVRQAY